MACPGLIAGTKGFILTLFLIISNIDVSVETKSTCT